MLLLHRLQLPAASSQAVGHEFASGTCVQVAYQACGLQSCALFRCDNGSWQCSDATRCGETYAHEVCGAPEPEPQPEQEPIPEPEDTTPSYDDVVVSHPAAGAAEKLRAMGALWGCAAGRFCPDQALSRAEIAYAYGVLELEDERIDIPTAQIFNDVNSSHWAFTGIQEAFSRSITYGCGGNNFCPEGSVSRAAAAVFHRRARLLSNGTSWGTFDDVSSGYWAAGAIERAAQDGLIGACSPGNFCPTESITRGDFALLLIRGYGL
ncbi:MAG: S-layer homology domain-containing protein [Deltaproteobacteria bacterium]|nr:S-layer homology domain-containing protein [Deltaproteobacteria bacterium]